MNDGSELKFLCELCALIDKEDSRFEKMLEPFLANDFRLMGSKQLLKIKLAIHERIVKIAMEFGDSEEGARWFIDETDLGKCRCKGAPLSCYENGVEYVIDSPKSYYNYLMKVFHKKQKDKL